MKIKKGFIKNGSGDRWFVVPTESLNGERNAIIRLNATGNEIWCGIEAGKTVDEIALDFVRDYGISEEKAKESVLKMTEKMRDAGILEDE